jgi:MarR family transcriptional regulator, organic hydroperoxide resistance regulator
MKRTTASADYLDLARLVLRLSRHLTRTFDEALGPSYGLATKDFLVLRVMQGGERYPGGIAGYLNMPPASVSRVLERLESKGFIVRSVDPQDHRRFRLEVTDVGATAAEAIRGLLRETLNRSYAHVPASTLRAAIEELTTLNEALEAR